MGGVGGADGGDLVSGRSVSVKPNTVRAGVDSKSVTKAESADCRAGQRAKQQNHVMTLVLIVRVLCALVLF